MPSTLLHVILALVLLDLIFVPLILFGAMRAGFGPLGEKFPPVEPEAEAVRRKFQSFRIGLINLVFGVHVAADAGHLHLTPVRVLQRLGARPASIPWPEIEIVGRRRKSIVARAGGVTMTGPRWCLELAEPGGW